MTGCKTRGSLELLAMYETPTGAVLYLYKRGDGDWQTRREQPDGSATDVLLTDPDRAREHYVYAAGDGATYGEFR